MTQPTPKSTLIELVRLSDKTTNSRSGTRSTAAQPVRKSTPIKAKGQPARERKTNLTTLLATGRRFARVLSTISASQLTADDLVAVHSLLREMSLRLDEIEGTRPFLEVQ